MTSDRKGAPAYIDKLLAGGGAVEPYIHLGYWPEPASAGVEHADLLAAQARLDERLRALAGLHDGLHVLDVGCGVGGTLAAVDAAFSGMELTGLNIDPAQLEVARKNVRPRAGNTLTWVRGDACALPFRDASMDRVLAIECVFHFGSRRRFFSEAARVLRPGGRLVLSDFVATDALRRLRQSDEYPGFALEAAIVPAVGPWPDFWGEDADDAVLADEAGLSLEAREDASSATLPSYRCFLSDKPAIDASRLDPVDRAMVLVEWLQRRRFLRMELFAFTRRSE